MRFKYHSLLLLLLAFAVGAPAQTPASAEPKPKISALDSGLFYQLLLGELKARGEDPPAGFALLLDAARKTNDPALFRRAVHVALQTRSGESALLAAKAWSQTAPSSREANRYVLQVLLSLNRVADTLDVLRREVALTPANEQRDAIWSIPSYFEHTSDTALAAGTVKKAFTLWLQDPVLGPSAWAVVGRMSFVAGDRPAALAATNSGLNLDARAEHPALVALSLMSQGLKTAESLVQKHLPYARTGFRMAYARALLGIQRVADAKVELQNLREQRPDYPDAWLVSGALSLQDGKTEDAQQQLQSYLDLSAGTGASVLAPEVRRGRTQAYFSLAQIAQLRKDFKLADQWLQRIDNPDDLLQAQIRRAVLLSQQGQLEDALALIEHQPERASGDAQLKRAAQVQLLKEHHELGRALSVAQASIAAAPDDHAMVYELAMLHEKLGELDQMERLLRSLILLKPEDPHPYNALGYSLADRGLRLPEAKALISQALALAPKDPFITDSLGWAEFRSGNLEAALELLQAAFNDKPDAEIAAHLGEVLWVLKRPAQATEVWRRGTLLSPSNETLLETLKRLQVSL